MQKKHVRNVHEASKVQDSTLPSAAKIHTIVEYLKRVGFDLETDELIESYLPGLLAKAYDVHIHLSQPEQALLLMELLPLAEANEIREAQVKGRELFPEDEGVVLVHGLSEEGSGSSYPVFYRYPVKGALRELSPQGLPHPPGASFPWRKEAPAGELS